MNNENNKPMKVADLYDDKISLVLSDQEQLNGLLNTPPKKDWVKTHPHINNHEYLPIDKVEYLLKKIFKLYKIEVLDQGQILNSIYCKVRVHYYNPVTEEWSFHDGVGAAELQTQKGTGTLKLDMSNINKGAIPMALPIAKSYAIKDACDHLGTIFGADLNRRDAIAFIPDPVSSKENITKTLTDKIPA